MHSAAGLSVVVVVVFVFVCMLAGAGAGAGGGLNQSVSFVVVIVIDWFVSSKVALPISGERTRVVLLVVSSHFNGGRPGIEIIGVNTTAVVGVVIAVSFVDMMFLVAVSLAV